MMACSYLSAAGLGMKAASTSAACWTPPAMPSCPVPEMDGPSVLPNQTYLRPPPGLHGLLAPGPSFTPPSGLSLAPTAITLTPCGLNATPGLVPTQYGLMSTPPGLTPTQTGLKSTPTGLMQEPALDLTTTPSLKPGTKSSPSDDANAK